MAPYSGDTRGLTLDGRQKTACPQRPEVPRANTLDAKRPRGGGRPQGRGRRPAQLQGDRLRGLMGREGGWRPRAGREPRHRTRRGGSAAGQRAGVSGQQCCAHVLERTSWGHGEHCAAAEETTAGSGSVRAGAGQSRARRRGLASPGRYSRRWRHRARLRPAAGPLCPEIRKARLPPSAPVHAPFLPRGVTSPWSCSQNLQRR